MDTVYHKTSTDIKIENSGESLQIGSLDYKHICRLCLGTKAEFNIFQDEPEETIKRIQVCCALEVVQDDGLPGQICIRCLELLETATKFRTDSQESDKILRMNYLLHQTDDLAFSDADVKQEFYTDNEADSELIEAVDIKYVKLIKKEKKKKNKTKERKPTENIQIKIKSSRQTSHGNSNLCTTCGKYFEKRSAYHSHLRTHLIEEFHCDECQKTFSRKAKLQEHLVTHFGVKNIPCTECGKMFASRSYVQKHVNKVHKRKRKVQCNVCLKLLADNYTLKFHMKTHTGEKSFQCTLCLKQFTFKLSLQYHMRTHTGEKPYACRYCDKRFLDLKSSSDHQMLHTGETPYKCPICSKGYTQLSNMKSHFRYNHKGQDIRDYPCYKKRKTNVNLIPKTPIV